MLTGYFSLTLVRNAVMYRIVPSHTSLSFSYSGNTLTGSYRLSIKVYEQDGDKAIDHTIQPAPIYTYCGFDGDVSYSNSIYTGIDISASAASQHKNYTIEIWLGQKGSEGAVKVDRVTIPILKDGVAGQPGNRGPGGAKPRTTEWKAGTRYLKGDEGEEYYDMVDYQGYMYLCVRTHTSSAGAPPPGNSDWQLQFRQPFITADTLRSYRIYADQIEADGLTAKNVNIEGHITATSGSFTGEIIAKSGKIGGWNIIGNNLSCSGFNTKILVEASGTRFLRINDTETVMCSIRADESTGISISTYGGSKTRGLSVRCNGLGYAIESYGAVELHTRGGEYAKVEGLAVRSKIIRNTYTIDSSDDFLIVNNSSNITINMGGSIPGKIIHIKRIGNKTVTLVGKIVYQSQSSYSTTLTLNDHIPRMFIYGDDGNWYESAGKF